MNVDRRVFAVLGFVMACDREVEDGVFAPTGTPTAPTTVASGNDDDDARGTSEGSAGDDGDAETSAASDPTFGDPASTGTDAAESDPSDPDPTDDPSDPDPTDDPSDPDPSDTTGDPTGVDPTGVDPTGAASNCCDVQLVAGCDDPAVEGCVCGLDAFCCDVEWDDLCVDAAADCGAACAGGGGGGGGEDCCVGGDLPGCSDAAVEACVCGLDPFCCDTAWDDTCAAEAVIDCFAAC